MLHECKLGNNASKTSANNIKAWEEECTSRWTLRSRFIKIRSGDESLEDEEDKGWKVL